MRTLLCGLVALLCLMLAGCGGGGGGSSTGSVATLTGRIVAIETGGAPNPQASVQSGGATVLSNATDGSFTLTVPAGTSTVTVDTQTTTSGVWTFTIPAASGAQDVGDLWVGPNRVSISGSVVDSASSNPVVGAKVAFGGAVGKTDASGNFSVSPVAYPTSNFAAFWGIVGNINATNYFANTFTASPNTSSGGVVTVGQILMTPLSSTTPPPQPYTIWGHISPASTGANATVTLSSGGTVQRITTADSSGIYYFWIGAGTYTLHFANGTHTTSDQTVTVAATNDVHRVDVTLN